MRAVVIALCALLIGSGLPRLAGAQLVATPGIAGTGTSTLATPSSGLVQLAESNTKSPNKLADKYLQGKSGGRYGIGGTESKVFKKKKK